MKPISELISKFGLTNNEAKVYAAILALETPRASDITNYAKVPRTKLYEITRSLEKKGFIETIPDRIQRFRVVPFGTAVQPFIDEQERRVQTLKESKQRMEQFIKTALKIQTRDEPTGQFTIYKAKNIINKKMEDIIKNSDSSLFMLLDSSELKYIAFLRRRLAQRNRIVKILTPITLETANLIKPWLPFNVKDFTEIPIKIISNDKEILIFRRDDQTALYSEDSKFISLMDHFFQRVWDTSVSAYDKIQEIKTGKPVQQINYVKNQEEYYENFKNLIENARTEIIIFTTSKGLIRMYNNVYQLLKKARNRGCYLKFLIPITEENKEIAKKIRKIAEIRHTPNITTAITYFDGEWVTFSEIKYDRLSIKNATNVSVITNQEGMINILKNICDMLWETATDLDARIKEIETGQPAEEIRIVKGRQNFYEMFPELIDKTKKEIINMISINAIKRLRSFALKEIVRANKRGIKLKFLVPITKDNAGDVKFMSRFAEIRHVDSVYMSMTVFDDFYSILGQITDDNFEKTSQNELIFTNNTNTVRMVKTLLEDTWQNGVSAKQRISQLETGALPEEVRILKGEKDVYDKSKELSEGAKKTLDIITTENGLERGEIHGTLAIEKEKSRKGTKVRFILPVTQKNIERVKLAAKFAEIKHQPLIPIRLKIVDDEKCFVGYGGEQSMKLQNFCVHSNAKDMIESMKYYFEDFWDNATKVEERINELELETNYAQTKTFPTENGFAKIMDSIKNAKKEVLIATSPNTFNSLDDVLIEELLEKGVSIKIAVPITTETIEKVKSLYKKVEIKHVPKPSLRSTIVDRKNVVIVVRQDDFSMNSVFSDDNRFISSAVALFESLWDAGMDAALRILEFEGTSDKDGATIIVSREDIDEIARNLNSRALNSKNLIITADGMARSFDSWFEDDMKLIKKNVPIRIITEITEKNVEFVERYLKFAKIRHSPVNDIPRLNFVDDSEGIMIFGKEETPEILVCLWSSHQKQVMVMRSYFEKMWENSIPAEDKLRELKSAVIN